jgi:Putative metal-binding motif
MHILPLLILGACQGEYQAEIGVKVDAETIPTVMITEPIASQVLSVNTILPCAGQIFDELEDYPTDQYFWYLDQVEIGSGVGGPTGEVHGSLTLTDYASHVLELKIVDVDGNVASEYILLDVGDEPDSDGDGVADSADCNPTNATLYQSGSWYPDADHDGYGSNIGFQSCGPWAGYVTDPTRATDCDDGRGDVHPGATELCNGRDDDCEGSIDRNAADAQSWYADVDGDQWGDSTIVQVSCYAPNSYVPVPGDCADTDPTRHPGAPEDCGGSQDMDCDGVIGGTLWYRDADFDGYGDSTVIASYTGCDQPTGYINDATDCNDQLATVNPGMPELCDPQDIDEDCDQLSDDNDPSTVNRMLWSDDDDLDGYGNWAQQATACDAPAGYILDATDCNDFDVAVYPGATEYCNGADDDCDGVDDNDAVDASIWYGDGDGDGYGTPTATAQSCSQPPGYAGNAEDCDDGDGSINPGTLWYADQDGDNYGDVNASIADCTAPTGYLADSTDCDDNNPDTHPLAPENCDAVDQDCDGAVDEEVADDGYEVAGLTPYNLGTFSTSTSVVGWFSSTDTVGEDWYVVTVDGGTRGKKVKFSYVGPTGHSANIADNAVNPKSYNLTTGVPVEADVGARDTLTFTIQIIADPSLTDSDLCADPYTLTIQ